MTRMEEEQDGGGATASRQPALALRVEPCCTVSTPRGFDQAQGNEPEWLRLALDTVRAVAFQRATRGVHVVGRDGRVRLGCVDLLGMYAVDEVMRQWAAYLSVTVPELPAPDESTAMRLLAGGGTWRDFLASAMSAREGQDRNGLGAMPASAVPSEETADAPPHPNPGVQP
jgi:hypothetical protein